MNDLRDLKSGDAVLVTKGSWEKTAQKQVVAKVLKRKIVLDNGTEWLLSGSEWGGGTWSTSFCRPFDQKLFDDINHRNEMERVKNKVCRFFSSPSCSKLTEDQWRQSLAICESVDASTLGGRNG